MLSEKEYEKIAKEALNNYSIIFDELVYLGKSDNVTFRVDTRDDNLKYLIKIHISTSSIKTKDVIESELIWLEALARDSNLVIPTPIRNLKDELITEIKEEKLIVTLHNWVKGEVLNRQPTSNETISLALLMADLHKHSIQWNIPEGFKRTIYNSDNLFSSLSQLKQLLNLELITNEEFACVEDSAHKISNVIESQKLSQNSWGIIHSDLHESNYVFYKDSPRPIDFSNCGHGFYLFDIAETFMHLSFENRKLFISTYRNVHQLQENYIEVLEAFFIWSIVRTFGFHSLNPNEHKSLSESFPSVIQNYFKKYLKDEKFLLR